MQERFPLPSNLNTSWFVHCKGVGQQWTQASCEKEASIVSIIDFYLPYIYYVRWCIPKVTGDVSMKKTGRPRKVAPLTSILHFSGLRQSVPSMMYIKCGQNSTSESCFSSGNLLYCTIFSLETCMGVNVDQLRIIQAKYVFTTILSAYLLERRI